MQGALLVNAGNKATRVLDLSVSFKACVSMLEWFGIGRFMLRVCADGPCLPAEQLVAAGRRNAIERGVVVANKERSAGPACTCVDVIA